MSNPLLQDFNRPPFSEFDATQVSTAIFQLMEGNLQAIENLLDREKEPNFGSIVMPLEEIEDKLTKAWSMVSHLNSVANTPQLRKAYHECLPKLSDYATQIGQNKRLYQAFIQIKESAAFSHLTTAQQKVVTNALRDFKLSGVALPEEKRAQFAKLNQALSEYSSQFQDHVMDATDAWFVDIQDVQMLAGIPEQNISLAAQAAQKANVPGWRLTLDFPCYFAVITYADNRDLRQQLHRAYATRASELGASATHDNSDLIEKIMVTRHELAQLLDFNNYAERSLATKMAKEPTQVIAFLEALGDKAKPFAIKEFAELKDFAHTEFGIEELAPWDLGYYSEKLKQKKYAISEEMIRPYFPVQTVLTGMFEVVRRLYGLQFKEVKEIERWHEDVQFFEVIDRNQALRGEFYIDLFARNQKRGGAWMDEAKTRRLRPNGQLQYPIAYLTCNFRPASGDVPALLTHDEVLTLFHEFGHGLHHLLTKMDYAAISGINGVAWDAVELPSQFMENWCWQLEALAFISSHYQTHEPLPEPMLKKMLKAKHFQSAMSLMRQIEFALFDFTLHLEFDPKKGAQAQQILDKVRAKYSVTPIAPYARFAHSFNHIFAGGYGAGYYSYLWAEVLSCDAFSRFEEEGIFNPETGNAFLEKILEKGGSVDPDILFRDFRGRDPDLAPFLKSHQLK